MKLHARSRQQIDVMEMQKNIFTVAGHTFHIETGEGGLLKLLPNMAPFITDTDTTPLFSIVIDNTLIPEWRGRKVGTFPCPSATFEVYKSEDGSYQFLVTNENGTPSAFFQSDAELKRFTLTTQGDEQNLIFGLNNSIMVIYTICTAKFKTLLIHSSVVENKGRGYMFLGKSGSGKSTHSDLWTKHITGSRLINDDNPVIRISEDGTPVVYGSPWSGKRPVYMNVNYPIGGMTAIVQNKENCIKKENVVTAFGILLSSCSTMKFDKEIHMNICSTITCILERSAVHTLFCLPDKGAAELSSSTFGA